MFQNGFLVVCREISNGTSTGETCIFDKNDTSIKVKYTEHIQEAAALQKAMLVGCDVEQVKSMITKEEAQAIINNLNKAGRDRISNSEGECFIFVMFEH